MSLTDRIRPNVEAAPWVIAEIKKREEITAALIAEIDRLKAENAKLRHALLTAENNVHSDRMGGIFEPNERQEMGG